MIVGWRAIRWSHVIIFILVATAVSTESFPILFLKIVKVHMNIENGISFFFLFLKNYLLDFRGKFAA